MIDNCRDHFTHFNPFYVHEAVGEVQIAEANPAGFGVARFSLSAPGVRIKSRNSGPLLWSLQGGRCADGAILTFHDDGARLHIVELKGKVDAKAWAHIQDQFKGMLFSALSVARLLCAPEIVEVLCYVVMAEDALSNDPAASSSPALLKTLVGGKSTLGGVETWFSGKVHLPYGFSASLKKATKDASKEAHFGTI